MRQELEPRRSESRAEMFNHPTIQEVKIRSQVISEGEDCRFLMWQWLCQGSGYNLSLDIKLAVLGLLQGHVLGSHCPCF